MKPSPYTDHYSQQEIDDYYGAGLWSTDTFHDLLVRRVKDNPDKVFATDGTRSLTFRQLFDGAQRLAVGLHRQGWRAGDTAAVQLPSWVEFVQVLAALSRLGVIVVPIMPIYRREEVGYVLSNAGIRGVFTPATFKKFSYLDMYLGLRQEHPDLDDRRRPGPTAPPRPSSTPTTVCSACRGWRPTPTTTAPAQELADPPGPDEPFVIVYTSGTTSRSKGCVHTFNTYCAGARALIAPFGYTEADVQFGPSPVAHTTGLVTSVLVPMLAGAATHVMAEWDPARGIDEIQRFGCTAAVTAPTFLHGLLSEYDAERHDLSVVAVVDMCGRADPCRGRRAGQRNASQHQGAQPLRAQRKPGHHHVFRRRRRVARPDLGRPAVPGAEVKIVDLEGNEVPRGTEGDIAYRGPAHMIEYLANPEETAALFTADGFSQVGRSGRDDRRRLRAGDRQNQRHRHSRRNEHQRPRNRGQPRRSSGAAGVVVCGHARRAAR